MVYWKCPGFCTFFLQTSTWYTLFTIYYAVIWTFMYSLKNPLLMTNFRSGGFNLHSHQGNYKRIIQPTSSTSPTSSEKTQQYTKTKSTRGGGRYPIHEQYDFNYIRTGLICGPSRRHMCALTSGYLSGYPRNINRLSIASFLDLMDDVMKL